MRRGRPRVWLVALLCAVAAPAAGCGAEGADGADGVDLEGRTFLSTDVRGRALVEGTVIELRFDEGRVAASAGCNQMGGNARWDRGTLDVEGPLETTAMGCVPELQAQDEWLAEFLTSRPALAVSGDTLTLGDEREGITLEERRDLSLEGTTWVVDGLIQGSTVASLPEGVEASVTVDAAEGRLLVAAGCNRGSGPVTVQPGAEPAAGTLTVGPVVTTRMRCPDDRMVVEEHVLAVLQRTVAYQIDGRTLTLTNGDRGLTLAAR